MYRYQQALGQFLRRRDEPSAVQAMAKQRHLWLAAGILTILGLVMGFGMSILGVAFTASSQQSQGFNVNGFDEVEMMNRP